MSTCEKQVHSEGCWKAFIPCYFLLIGLCTFVSALPSEVSNQVASRLATKSSGRSFHEPCKGFLGFMTSLKLGDALAAQCEIPPHIAQYPVEIVSQRGVSRPFALFSQGIAQVSLRYPFWGWVSHLHFACSPRGNAQKRGRGYRTQLAMLTRNDRENNSLRIIFPIFWWILHSRNLLERKTFSRNYVWDS